MFNNRVVLILITIFRFAKDNIVRHVKSGVASMIIQRKISLKAMLTWTKRNVKAPMIATVIKFIIN